MKNEQVFQHSILKRKPSASARVAAEIVASDYGLSIHRKDLGVAVASAIQATRHINKSGLYRASPNVGLEVGWILLDLYPAHPDANVTALNTYLMNHRDRLIQRFAEKFDSNGHMPSDCHDNSQVTCSINTKPIGVSPGITVQLEGLGEIVFPKTRAPGARSGLKTIDIKVASVKKNGSNQDNPRCAAV